MVKHISCDFNSKFNSTTCNLNKKWNNETCQWESKNYRTSKKGYSWNHSTCICENCNHLKCIVDYSKIVCNGIINVHRYCINKGDK